MKRLFFLFFLVTALLRATDFALPSVNQGAWLPGTNVGVPGGIEQYLAGGANDRAVTGNVINVVTAHSADNTGATNVSTAVAAAISAATAGDVIYFPAGTYKFTGIVYIPIGKANITIRGAGVGVTTFNLSSAGTRGMFNWPDIGYVAGDVQTVTGTKTKGTSTLTVASNSGFTTTDMLAWVGYENEVDETRIEAGVNPVWSSLGHAWSRTMTVRVTGTTSTTISIDPPLPADGTNLAMRIHHYGYPTYSVLGWGFEDFTVTFDTAAKPEIGFNVSGALYNWFYNVHFPSWALATSNGSPIKMAQSYRSQIQKCKFHAETGASSDGAIETGANSSTLIVDNIFTGPFGYNTYDSGNSVNTVIAYNYAAAGGPLSGFHNAHPSLNLIEGNVGDNHQSDGYHGSSSNNTIFRNYLRSAFPLVLQRFKRQYVIAGNHFGTDGSAMYGPSWGNPNINNGNANGFAGPTGLSDQVGQLDYQQNGGTPNTYTIVSGDVFAGDFWADFELTGTLTTRISDTVGVITVSGGVWFTGAGTGGDLYPRIYWSSKTNATGGVGVSSVTAVSGSLVTMSFPGATLPDEGTSLQIYTGPGGFQERDLDVKASSTLVENYWSSESTGSIQDGTSDTLPNSLAYTSKPSWFGNLDWPPFEPNNVATQSVVRIPAGYRFTNGNEDYLGGGGGNSATVTGSTTVTGTLTLP